MLNSTNRSIQISNGWSGVLSFTLLSNGNVVDIHGRIYPREIVVIRNNRNGVLCATITRKEQVIDRCALHVITTDGIVPETGITQAQTLVGIEAGHVLVLIHQSLDHDGSVRTSTK